METILCCVDVKCTVCYTNTVKSFESMLLLYLRYYVPPVTFKSLLEATPFAEESIFNVPKPFRVIFVFAKITASISSPLSSVNSPVTFRLFVEFCVVVTYTFFALTAYTVGLFVFVIDTFSIQDVLLHRQKR